ncbi:MAG: DUF3667 domain-containing protein [Planctomycetota bacterium]
MAKEPLVPDPESGPRRCPNCTAVATHQFCPQCGQATKGLRASFRALIADFFTVWFGAEAKSWRSLKMLFRRPGQLTLEYQEGRRARYVAPLRLYLFLSIVLFLVVKLQGHLAPEKIFSTNIGNSGDQSQLQADEFGPLEKGVRESWLSEDSWWQSPIRELLIERTHRFDRMSEEHMEQAISAEVVANLPIGLLLVLPFLALYLRILWFRFGAIYFDHFIFALHFQSFLFAQILLYVFLPIPSWVGALIFAIYSPIYLTLAQVRLTGRSPWRCIFNAVVLGPMLFFTLIGMFLFLILFSFLTV